MKKLFKCAYFLDFFHLKGYFNIYADNGGNYICKELS